MTAKRGESGSEMGGRGGDGSSRISPESGVVWKKSSRSIGGGSCVEVAEEPCKVSIRDTKWEADGDRRLPRPVISIDPVSWADFLGHVERGATEIVVPGLSVKSGPAGTVRFCSTTSQDVLDFNAAEWRAFVDGVDEFGRVGAGGSHTVGVG